MPIKIAGRTPSIPLPTPASTGPKLAAADPKLVQNVAKLVKGTPLAGHEQTVVAAAQKYDVPVAFALAQFQVESQMAQKGRGAVNKNPGNLRYAGQAGATNNGGFAKFGSLDQGITAYFQNLDRNYRGFLDRGDLVGLLNKYAPPSDGNNVSGYAKLMNQIVPSYEKTLGA